MPHEEGFMIMIIKEELREIESFAGEPADYCRGILLMGKAQDTGGKYQNNIFS